ncbi:MAG: hypothetical protein KJZ85_09010 [Rhodobacteraceae bacterium]|jgi:hypothetical protein|nr:hypothetical protein [Paracoccaceae bacterium]
MIPSRILAAAAVAVAIHAPAAVAGPIESACNASGRQAASRALCACIQVAADATLTRSDQRRASRFFSDPHQAQEVRMSKSDSDSAFWDRYRAFGALAESRCARG